MVAIVLILDTNLIREPIDGFCGGVGPPEGTIRKSDLSRVNIPDDRE